MSYPSERGSWWQFDIGERDRPERSKKLRDALTGPSSAAIPLTLDMPEVNQENQAKKSRWRKVDHLVDDFDHVVDLYDQCVGQPFACVSTMWKRRVRRVVPDFLQGLLYGPGNFIVLAEPI